MFVHFVIFVCTSWLAHGEACLASCWHALPRSRSDTTKNCAVSILKSVKLLSVASCRIHQ